MSKEQIGNPGVFARRIARVGRWVALRNSDLDTSWLKRPFVNGKPIAPGARVPALPRAKLDVVDFDRLHTAPAVQLIARDAFISELAVKFDQLQGEFRAFSREFGEIKKTIVELRDEGQRNARFAAFQEKEVRTRSARIDEVARRFADLKERLDAIDGKSRGDYHAYRSFEAVSRRLTEIGALEREFRAATRSVRLAAGVFCAGLACWIAVLVAGS